MAENSAISWTDHTFNPWIGCTKVGPGCDNCYAKADFEDRKHRVIWGAGQARSRTSPTNWNLPFKWDRQAKAAGVRARVFCASLADVFDNEVDPAWRDDLFWVIHKTPNLDWLLLTKRIGNAAVMMREAMAAIDPMAEWPLPLPNVWIGATIVNQEEADRDIPKLLAVPAHMRFLSMEPLLGPVDIERWAFDREKAINDCMNGPAACNEYQARASLDPCVDWVIVGGESGPNARPMHPDWARSLRNQCAAAGVPFHFKQWGEWCPGAIDDPADGSRYWEDEYGTGVDVEGRHRTETIEGVAYCRIGKKAAGRLLDGVTHDASPEVR